MPKHRYKFHPESLIFIRENATLAEKLRKGLKYFAAGLVISILSYIVFPFFIDTPEERSLRRENEELMLNFELISKRFDQLKVVLEDLQNRDDNIYRIIFEAEPIHSSIREAGIGGIDRYSYLEGLSNSKIVIQAMKQLDILSKKAYIQSKSFDKLIELAKRKDELAKSIPCIIPLKNKDITRVASSFGMRIHPFYKVLKMHTGMDFTAPTGTDVFVTGDGIVKDIEYTQRGYGYHVIIDHGFGYETLYAHLSEIVVKKNQKVQRGSVIGKVGNTGMSIAPHLHYEVIRNGKPINPINFYFNDLTPDQYDKLIEIASQPSQSFD